MYFTLHTTSKRPASAAANSGTWTTLQLACWQPSTLQSVNSKLKVCAAAQNVYSSCALAQMNVQCLYCGAGLVSRPVCCTSCACTLPAGLIPCSTVQTLCLTADRLKSTFVTAMCYILLTLLQELSCPVACTMSTNQVADTRLCLSCDFGHHGGPAMGPCEAGRPAWAPLLHSWV